MQHALVVVQRIVTDQVQAAYSRSSALTLAEAQPCMMRLALATAVCAARSSGRQYLAHRPVCNSSMRRVRDLAMSRGKAHWAQEEAQKAHTRHSHALWRAQSASKHT
jgi:hypothetical protein